jgi:hypothetical protein
MVGEAFTFTKDLAAHQKEHRDNLEPLFRLKTNDSHSKSYLLQTPPTENNGILKHIFTGKSQNFNQKEEMSKALSTPPTSTKQTNNRQMLLCRG